MEEAIKYISLFSGIEAASVAWGPLGWEPLAFCEVDEFPSAVLAHRFPDVPNLEDITKADWKEVIDEHGRPDVVVGGSPCQSFSIAGGRESLGGESRLMFEYIRACDEIRSPWILWENVPGVLNTRDNAFAQLLDSLQDVGYVDLAWRVLDAQFFGVAQRRRRVFLVGHLGAGGASAAVLFEPESVRGNTQTSREKREALARAAGRGPAAGGGDGAAYGFCGYASHTARSIGYAEETSPTLKGNDWQIGVPDVLKSVAIRTANSGANGSGISEECAHTLACTQPEAVVTHDAAAVTQYSEEVAGTLTARHDSSPCADRGQNVVCMASGQANSEVTTDGTSPTVTCLHERPIVCVSDDTPESRVLKIRQGKAGGGKGALIGEEVSFTLATSQDQTLFDGTGTGYVVRRLTPVECERLQGFPDGWTDIPYRGKEHPPDTPRYKALGNSMATPCMRWLGERIQMVQEIIDEQ